MAACPSCGLPAPHNGPCPNSHTLATGSKILQGRYEIIDILGQGGMGTVYMARDLRLNGRECVVKKLRDDFYREEDRQKAQGFFEREAAVLSKLQHPNIVHILDYFKEESDCYLVMEYVKGSDLHHILTQDRRGQPFDEDGQVIPWAIQICDVLSYLHTENVIYRDLKPSNIMIDIKGQVKLVDFGIARRWEEPGENTHVVSAGYSPPEQYWGAAGPQSDIYALGATMTFLLTGKDPEALHQSSPIQVNPDVSEYTDKLIQRATAQDLNERFQTVEEMREALLQKDFVSAPETSKSRVGEIAVGVVLIVVAAILYLGPMALEPFLQKQQQAGAGTNPSEQSKVIDRPTTQTVMPKFNTAPVRSNVDHSDLAVQDTNEASLTDPAGFEPVSEQPQQAEPEKQSGGFKLPW